MESVYSVGQANLYIKNMFAQDFLLRDISVRGEVSNCKYHSSGHIYFSIKDRTGVLSCVMFAGKRRGLDFVLQEGLKIVVTGSIEVYERDGKYQLYANKIQKEGTGDLYKKYLMLKQELEEMGMFDESYKKPIPKYVSKVGIVTAKTGAAIQDIINIANRRNPYISLYLFPAKVQGEGAALSIKNGIEYMDNFGVDVIIVGRGGGSIEDLWAFNEEMVARAIFNCETPIISAVGHEVDFTIADFVSDLRAPTPSAAAELAIYEFEKFNSILEDYQHRFNSLINKKILNYRKIIDNAQWKLNKMSPESMINSKRQIVSDSMIFLEESINKKILDRKNKLAILSEKLNGFSPLNKISKGYAYVCDESEKPIKSIETIKCGDEITIQLKDGKLKTEVLSIKNEELFANK